MQNEKTIQERTQQAVARLALTPVQSAIFDCLRNDPGRTVTRDRMIRAIWRRDLFLSEVNLDEEIDSVNAALTTSRLGLRLKHGEPGFRLVLTEERE